MIDTNAFIAAFKAGYTTSTKLLLKLLTDPSIELVVDDILLKEYEKWFHILHKELKDVHRQQAKLLFMLIKAKSRIVLPETDTVEKLMKYLPDTEIADAYHAATCLKTKAILISNDKDFKKLSEARIVEVWTISEAIKRLLH